MPPKTTTRRTPPPRAKGGPRTYGRLQKALDETARREIVGALTEAHGNVSDAALALGISRRSMYKRLTTLGIDPTAHRS